MSLARPMGELDVNTSRECEHRAPHDAQAAAIVPCPNEAGAAGKALCPFHLALWNDIHDGLVEESGCADAMADGALLHLDDLPETLELDGLLFDRVGIDHTGEAHYVWEHRNGWVVKILSSGLETISTHTYGGPEFEHWLEHVHLKRGWMLLDDDYSGVIREGR